MTFAANNCSKQLFVDNVLVNKRCRDSTGLRPIRTGNMVAKKCKVKPSKCATPSSSSLHPPYGRGKNCFLPYKNGLYRRRPIPLAVLKRRIFRIMDKRATEAHRSRLADALIAMPLMDSPIARMHELICARKGWR